MKNEQYETIHNVVIVNVREAMDCVLKACNFTDEKNIAIAFINKSLYHMSIAKTLYVLHFSGLETNDNDDFFEAYEKFTKEFFSNYEQPCQHEWKFNYLTDLKECYIHSEFSDIEEKQDFISEN